MAGKSEAWEKIWVGAYLLEVLISDEIEEILETKSN